MDNVRNKTPRNSQRLLSWSAQGMLVVLVGSLLACSPSQQPGAGAQKRLKLMVGEINEVSLPSPADRAVSLTGTSDNAEVVDVSQKQTIATATGAPKPTAPDQLVFLIKGVTVGTARVVFSEKRTGEMGDGQVRKTYVVQVVSK